MLAGVALALLAWLVPRRVAGTGLRWNRALSLDLSFPFVTFLIALGLSGRPVFSGIVTLSLGAGYAFADRSKRRTLDEPIVFTDVFQAFDVVVRHPQLALPFPNKLAVLAGVGAIVAIYAALFFLESSVRLGQPFLGIGVVALVICALCAANTVFQSTVVEGLRKVEATGEPIRDAATIGPLGMHLVHGLVARGERAQRRTAAPLLPGEISPSSMDGPVILVQSESFFDARRLHPGIDRDLLPHFERASRDGPFSGRLTVPSWGANTVRTEFSVLTGLAPRSLGFDHFNPYRKFIEPSLASVASRYREQGYRTICLHPFDPTFYRRSTVTPLLGFDEMVGEEGFPSHVERVDGYVADIAVAHKAIEILSSSGPRTFLFIVTMENHGPWPGCAHSGDRLASKLDLPTPERDVLGRYLASLHNGDLMLGRLMAHLEALGSGVIAYYGDHLPGFGATFARLGLSDRRSDYLIWKPGWLGGSVRKNLFAEELVSVLLDLPG